MLLKTRHQDQNGVTYAKPQVTKPRLNYSFDLLQKWTLKPINRESPDQH